MPKLRKMLGRVDEPGIAALMGAIETQSVRTLALWAADYTREHCIPVWNTHFPDDSRPAVALDAVKRYWDGEIKKAELKAIVKEAAPSVKESETIPAAQAAARAMTVAAAVTFTPTNSLGMCFYAAAALAYHQAGLECSATEYDRMASDSFDGMLTSLNAVSVPDEPSPAKINWNC